MHRQMVLNAFLMGVGHHEAAWRLPESNPHANVDLAHYQHLARTAEAGRMDSVFFADSPSLMSSPARRPAEALDPTLLLAAMSAVTEQVGLIATASTTYEEPFNLARKFASLDHLSGGRAGWNIVTTAAADAAANFGLETMPTHAARYERAREFIEVVLRLWASWDEDAVVADKVAGIYADPQRVRPIDHVGGQFSVRGPLNVSRSVQGRPVLVQAGSSSTGIELAAEYAEAVFTAQRTLEDAQEFYARLKNATAEAGRDPGNIKILPGLVPILGGTEAEAHALEQSLDDLMVHEHALKQLSGSVGIPVAELDLDQPLPDKVADVAEIEDNKSRYALTVTMARREGLTVRQLLNRLGGGRGHRTLAGTPEQVADSLEQWFTQGAADGFNIMPAVLPSGLDAFVSEVVPILQKRGLFREAYTGATLRDHYGLSQDSGLGSRSLRSAG
jgi:FMN-dependent oxidoreductase (nitrilotriacetate monooxygenase family)